MRSRAHIQAHPLHPALIPFPLAFLSGAALFDLVAVLADNIRLSLTAADLTLAGIGAGLVAAIPGVIDFIYAVPPESSGKKRAAQHGTGNVVALALFALAFALRRADWTATTWTILAQLAGLVVLGYAGWLGGTLVTRNLISVDHRYADRGKWQEASFDAAAGDEIVVARTDEMQDGHMKLLRVNGRRIALARVGARFHAVDDRCTHRGGSLAGGVLVGSTVHCLWHGSHFDVRTGAVVCGPAKATIATYTVRHAEGQVFLTVPKFV
jgi:nitrite reductase/ring-hydroxylating ferredoxin subunit/uncharacterized membrane protein